MIGTVAVVVVGARGVVEVDAGGSGEVDVGAGDSEVVDEGAGGSEVLDGEVDAGGAVVVGAGGTVSMGAGGTVVVGGGGTVEGVGADVTGGSEEVGFSTSTAGTVASRSPASVGADAAVAHAVATSVVLKRSESRRFLT